MLCETFNGGHYEIGLQIGRRHAFWIERTLAQFVARHSHEFDDDEMQRLGDKWTGILLRKSPEHLEQIRGIADGSKLHLIDLLAMNFRFWNIIAARRHDRFGAADVACSNIAFRDPEMGVLLGGTLDDVRMPWLLARFAPAGRLRHLCATWIGTAWAGRGINEAGLAIGTSSMAIDGIDYAMDERFEDIAIKSVMEHASTADQAVEIFRSLSPFKGLSALIADRFGSVKLLETCWSGEQLHDLTDSAHMLSCVNHAKDGPLRRRMVEMGYTNQPSNWSRQREQIFAQLNPDEASTYNFAGMKKLLADHTGYPSSICCTSAVFHTIASPQHGEPGLWVADGPACQNRWHFISL